MEQQFIRTISEHQAIIHRVCRVYRDTPEDREDLFQEVIYQLWKAFPSFREQSRITTWMYRIALSTAMAKYRKKSAAVRTTTLDGVEVPTSTSPQAHYKQELLHRAIATLSDAEKAVITLYLDDYHYEEIAHITGMTANHVGVKLNRIKQKLIHQLNPQDHET